MDPQQRWRAGVLRLYEPGCSRMELVPRATTRVKHASYLRREGSRALADVGVFGVTVLRSEENTFPGVGVIRHTGLSPYSENSFLLPGFPRRFSRRLRRLCELRCQ